MPSVLARAGRGPARGRHACRHGGARVRRGPDWSAIATARVLKGGVGAGLSAGVAAMLLTPGPSSAVPPAAGTAAVARTADVRPARPESASRDSVRTPLSTSAPGGSVAVSAPADAGPLAHDRIGLLGFRAVPKVTSTAPAPVPTRYSAGTYAAAARALGLRPNAARVYSAVRTAFGITTIGGYRPGDSGDHGTGHAVDIMITGRAQGDAVAAFVEAHAAEFHVTYVIWRQRIWFPGTATWRLMEDRGSATANHLDHVHVSVS